MKTKTPYLFFKSFAGFSYDPKTETAEDGKRRCARELALAERKARDVGLSFVWQADDCTSEEFSDEKPFRQLFVCLLIDRTGKTSEFKSFCKPKGINSILKANEFTTGFESDTYGIERARLLKVKGEFICEIQGNSEEEMLKRLIAEYDRLIERTIQIKAIITQQNEEAEKLAA